eukprot:1153391-Pelagomonas_calceolata.AAC.8
MPSFRAHGRLGGSGQELHAKLVANVSTAPATASHAPLTLQGCQAVLFGSQSFRLGVAKGGTEQQL